MSLPHEQQLSNNYHDPSMNNMYSNGNNNDNNGAGMATLWTTEQQQQQQQQQQVVGQSKEDNNKQLTHPEWGVMKEQDFHPLTLKHQVDLENSHQSGNLITDFYFWQANLGGYCMADMVQNIVVSSEGAFPLVRRIVEGAPHPGRRKKKKV